MFWLNGSTNGYVGVFSFRIYYYFLLRCLASLTLRVMTIWFSGSLEYVCSVWIVLLKLLYCTWSTATNSNYCTTTASGCFDAEICTVVESIPPAQFRNLELQLLARREWVGVKCDIQPWCQLHSYACAVLSTFGDFLLEGWEMGELSHFFVVTKCIGMSNHQAHP